MSYTKGKWIVKRQNSFRTCINNVEGHGIIDCWSVGSISEEEKDANAKLAAASPLLLEAAEELMSDAKDRGDCYDHNGALHEDYQKLQDAINEAS